MKTMHIISHHARLRTHIRWWKRAFDLRIRGGFLAKLFQEQLTGKFRNGMPGQFVRFCIVGTVNAIIDFGVLNAALAVFPTRATIPLLVYNTAAVVLAATNSFVWNRYFTFHVRGPLLSGEIARFAVVAGGTAILNDLVLLMLSALFPTLMKGSALEANVLKLGAILGAMSLSFFGMRFWVFFSKRLSPASSAKARSLPSSS